MISESHRKLMGFGYGGDEINYHAGCFFVFSSWPWRKVSEEDLKAKH